MYIEIVLKCDWNSYVKVTIIYCPAIQGVLSYIQGKTVVHGFKGLHYSRESISGVVISEYSKFNAKINMLRLELATKDL